MRLNDLYREDTNTGIFPMSNTRVFESWREMITRKQEEEEHESFELQDLHEQVGDYLLEYLEELEGDLG